MQPQIEILEIILLIAGLTVFTFGFAGLKFNLADKIYSKYIFAGILVLSFISFQITAYIYLIKFDLYFGWNAAIMMFALISIIASPFLLRIIHTFKMISVATVKSYKHIQPAKKQMTQETKSTGKPILNKEPETVPNSLLPVVPIEESYVDNTKPFGITPDEVESAANITANDIESKIPQAEKENLSKTTSIIPENVPQKNDKEEQTPEDLHQTKPVTKKSTPVKKAPARKHSSNSKRRRKR